MKRMLMAVGVVAALLALFLLVRQAKTPGGAAQQTPAFDPAGFVSQIDNSYFPLKPGTRFYYEGTSDGRPAGDVMFVTFDTKVIQGVTTTVVRDQFFQQGVLEEDTIDWYAQDKAGNVWYFGEDTKELDRAGKVVSTEGSWQAGVDGVKPGIIMEAHPQAGDQYQQEYATGVAQDMAQVTQVNASVCVKYGCFDGVLATKEWSPLELGVTEQKSYAANAGNILNVTVTGGNERSELVRVTTETK